MSTVNSVNRYNEHSTHNITKKLSKQHLILYFHSTMKAREDLSGIQKYSL